MNEKLKYMIGAYLDGDIGEVHQPELNNHELLAFLKAIASADDNGSAEYVRHLQEGSGQQGKELRRSATNPQP